MSWKSAGDDVVSYELWDFLTKIPIDHNEEYNGHHIDEFQDALFDLMYLLTYINVIEYVDTGEGEPAIWLRKKYGK